MLVSIEDVPQELRDRIDPRNLEDIIAIFHHPLALESIKEAVETMNGLALSLRKRWANGPFIVDWEIPVRCDDKFVCVMGDHFPGESVVAALTVRSPGNSRADLIETAIRTVLLQQVVNYYLKWSGNKWTLCNFLSIQLKGYPEMESWTAADLPRQFCCHYRGWT